MTRRLFIASVCFWFLASSVDYTGAQSAQRPPTTGGNSRHTPATYTPVMLIGTVMFDDGTFPEEPVKVEMVCYGAVRRQTQATRGKFSISFGLNRPSRNMDVSVPNQASDDAEFYQANRLAVGRPSQAFSQNFVNSLDLSGCELRAVLDGFQSERILLKRRRPLDSPNVGEIILHPTSETAATTVSVTTLRAPKRAKRAFQKAQKELRKKQPHLSSAVRELEKAVEEFPGFAAAWHLLGTVHLDRKSTAAARQAFEQSITADPEYLSPYLSLATLSTEQGRWEQAAKWSSSAIELNPDSAYGQYLHSIANYTLGNLGLAEKSARVVREKKRARRYPITYFILGGIEAQRGNIPSATAEFNRFLELAPDSVLAEQSRQILAEWEQQGLIKPESATPE